MPLISSIIAKALALVDVFLSQWVTVTWSSSTASGNTCWSFQTANATVNACGQEFLHNLTDVVEGLTALLPYVLGGLFATGQAAPV
jgi:hypothetical protein